ncbi:DUF692 domain-containing protein [Fulvivirga ligni]|uniref:DUF692 domain-containing protein n=1 Tax=Fulvivirga ligni TaxID=2904246 RepID=UPI001F317591|nr:DUF692 family multinuclear iron-containing protein [Fulvivirga ligni]UII23153.1 DUF692 domain-containing protein [Fulvivirga ligni]
MNIPELGIGIIYFSGFKNVIESNEDLIDLIEIEPQTFWLKGRASEDSYVFNEEELNYLESLPQNKLFHGVGFPVGSSMPIDTNHIAYLQEMMRRLNPVWLSEHLSFNNIRINNQIHNTNFLLPPLQTIEGINVASKTIREYSSHFNLPFVFETGVNYLSPYPFELEDGSFINAVAQESDSHILLDIHNLLANQKNGRQNIRELIRQIDPERIIQIHLAGGFEYNGYYLDAHSNVSDHELMGLYDDIVQELPNLKAVTFEMLPEYLNFVPEKAIRTQLEKMRSIWDKRGARKKLRTGFQQPLSNAQVEYIPSVKNWEATLGSIALEKQAQVNTDGQLEELLLKDEGTKIIISLIKKFKSSLIVSSMKLTCRYILLKYGLEKLESLFADFWMSSQSLLFASENGIEFGSYLVRKFDDLEDDLTLLDLIVYELNSLKTLTDGQVREVFISFNPEDMIRSLSNKKIPEILEQGSYCITIEPELQETESVSLVMHT